MRSRRWLRCENRPPGKPHSSRTRRPLFTCDLSWGNSSPRNYARRCVTAFAMSSRRGFVGWSTAASVGAAAALAIAAGPVMRDKTAGTVKEFNIQSKVYGKQRRFWVYTPASYKTTAGDAYNLMVVFDGEDFQKEIPLPRILDSLSTARAIPPFVAVMIDNGSGAARLNDLAN